MKQDYILIPKGREVPAEADFALIMDTELMEPLIARGEQVYVSRRIAPAEFEVGIFYYKGKIYCRQYCEDYAGNLHLLCANSAFEKENLCLSKTEREKCRCLGKVLLKDRPPMPIYL